MREFLARSLAVVTAVIVVALAAAFSLTQNAPYRRLPGAGEAAPRAPLAGAPGRAAFERHGCSGCHAIGGEGNPRGALDGVGERLTAEAIRDWMVAAEAVRPQLNAGVARIKQSYAALPEEELRAIVEYLAGLRAPEGSR